MPIDRNQPTPPFVPPATDKASLPRAEEAGQRRGRTPAKALAAALLTTAMLAACGGRLPQGASVQSPPSSSSASSSSAIAPNTAKAADTDAAGMLKAYHWDLMAAFDARGEELPGWRLEGRSPMRLNFDAERLSVQNLCNAVGAGYTLDGGRLQVTRPVSTMRACVDNKLMALERRVAAQLPQAQRFELQGGGAAAPRLTLHFADGSRWEFAGLPTPATQYGSAGERIFLEVAPERVACNHPLMPNAQCLRVRDVRFADNGVRQGSGEWRIFQGEIEGYQHERGIRNVVRVQRYSLARNGQLPADGPSHAYVLDMVVESERVR